MNTVSFNGVKFSYKDKHTEKVDDKIAELYSGVVVLKDNNGKFKSGDKMDQIITHNCILAAFPAGSPGPVFISRHLDCVGWLLKHWRMCTSTATNQAKIIGA